MHLDCRDYPEGYTFAEVVAKAIGTHVGVADFQYHRSKRVFRMILDSEVDLHHLTELMKSTFADQQGTYKFSYLEAIEGPVVDNNPMRTTTQYIRVTFM